MIPAPWNWNWPGRIAVAAMVLAVRAYQWTLSPWLGDVCRFQPSCSRYMIGSLRKHGPIRGLARGVGRLLKCHPWHPGGYDPP
jgi:putative membrane protein insertion efficiency factor